MDLRRQLSVFRHWAWLILASMLLAGGASYVASSSLPKVYESKVRLIVGQSLTASNPDYNQLLASQRLSQTYAQVATSRSILGRVSDRLGLQMGAAELDALVDSSAPRDNTLIDITARFGDPDTAAVIANTVADELISASPTIQGRQVTTQQFVDGEVTATQDQIKLAQDEVQRLTGLQVRTPEQDSQIQTLQNRLLALRQTYSQLLNFSSNSASNLLTVLDPAVANPEPASPRVLLNTILAVLVGLMLAVGLVFLLEHLDDTVKSPADVADVVEAPTLGVIGRLRLDKKGRERQRLATLSAPRSPGAEAYRALRTNLEFSSVDQKLKSILLTSAVPGEGKTTTAANIALVFAQAGRRVTLLDADMRRPGVHKIFEVPNAFGLTNLLRNEEVTPASVSQGTDEPNLHVITTGPLPPNPAELLGSQRMKDILERLKSESDLLVVDSPPLQAVTDAAVLASELDGTLLVIDAGRTRRGAVRQAREALDRVGARVLGIALNRMSERSRAGYYYQYYGDYYGPRGGEARSDGPVVTSAAGDVGGRTT